MASAGDTTRASGGTLNLGDSSNVGIAGSMAVIGLGQPCAVFGQRNCDGNSSLQQLLCDPTYLKWIGNGLCQEGKRCDTSIGTAQGTCRDIVPECRGHVAGDHVCVTGELHACGSDLVTTDRLDACNEAVGECAKCRPVELANGQKSPASVAVGGGYLYWTTRLYDGGISNALVQLALASRAISVAATSSSSTSNWQIAADTTAVYWYGTGQIERIDAVDRVRTTLSSGGECCYGLAVRGNTLFATSTAIITVSLDGQTSPTTSPIDRQFSQIALDSTSVYWVPDGKVMRWTAGSSPTQLSTGAWVADTAPSYPIQVVVGSTFVYWSDQSSIYRVSIDGGTAEVVASGQNRVRALAIDANYLYWVASGVGTVAKVSLAGGPPVTVASNQGGPSGVAVDANSIYWTNSSSGTVMKIAK
jgi:hypothetical protein